ncbi:RING-type E3 ubiquitin transferase [Salvia divinorum]|uniref:RING-type E3 ubiquitin transferase n=1 Tax=Salvia divinorum TaxID=28513 RepID=A0ABD1I4H9_SALDI
MAAAAAAGGDGDLDYHYFARCIEFKKIESRFRPTRRDQLHRLRFNFFLNFETSNWIGSPNSTTLEITERLSWKLNRHATVIFGESLSLDGAYAAVEEALGGLMIDAERSVFVPVAIEFALGEAREKIPSAGKLDYGTLYVDFEVNFDRRRRRWTDVVEGEGDDYLGLVPAAELSLGMLERHEADGESCCSICLEEFGGGGGGVLRMPCSHYFHGGCIERWLKSSHYCPLCRFVMPT